MEIVGLENTELFFEKEKDGVKKIINVLKSQEKKDRLRSILDGRKNLFSQEKSYRDIKNFVDSFFV